MSAPEHKTAGLRDLRRVHKIFDEQHGSYVDDPNQATGADRWIVVGTRILKVGRNVSCLISAS